MIKILILLTYISLSLSLTSLQQQELDYFLIETGADILPKLNRTKLESQFKINIKRSLSATHTQLKVPPIDQIIEGASIAAIVPCDLSLLKLWKCKTCEKLNYLSFYDYVYDLITDTLVIILINNKDKSIVLAYRGTVSIRNGLLNQDKALIEYKSGKVHQGFYKVMKKLNPKLITKLKRLYKKDKFKDYNLKIYGHSMGGSVASLSILELQHKLNINSNKLYLFTYGQTRVANYEYVNYFNNQTFYYIRVVNYDDQVTHFPSYIDSEYIHFSNELFINQNEDLVYCNTKIFEDKTCSYSTWKVGLKFESHFFYLVDMKHAVNC